MTDARFLAFDASDVINGSIVGSCDVSVLEAAEDDVGSREIATGADVTFFVSSSCGGSAEEEERCAAVDEVAVV